MTSSPPGQAASGAAVSADLRVGQFYLDVASRRLLCLDDTARQLYRAGLPLTDLGAAPTGLHDISGAAVSINRLPHVVAARTGHPAEGDFVLTLPDRPDQQLHWSAAPLPNESGQTRAVLLTVVCLPPAPDWQALAGVAHDLATPLHTVGLLLDHLMGTESTPSRHVLDLLRGATERAREIGRDLLEWCRSAGLRGRPPRRGWIPLAPLLNELIAEQEPAARSKGLTLRCVLEPTRGWEVQTDPVWLGRIFANLLANALRYTPTGGTIMLSAVWEERPDGRVLALAVADTGAGIAPEEQESIFQAFERGQSGLESGSLGSGVGLAVVDHLAQELGLGRELDSHQGRGSTFRILLPAQLLRPAIPGKSSTRPE